MKSISNKNNSCIYILSGRPYMLEECVERLYDFYNCKYNFPLYIYFFDDLYLNNKNKTIAHKISTKYNVKFVSVRTEIPKHINYRDLYFFKNYPYVKKSFGPERINFLHMNHFLTNSNNKPELDKFRYHHRLDDDVFVNKKINNNLFEIMISGDYKLATSGLWNKYTPNQRDTRINLFEYYKNFVLKNNITPSNDLLRSSIETNNEKLFHQLKWSSGHFNLYDQKYLRDNNNWKEFIRSINNHGGIFKYRWGDLEIIGLFLYTFFKNPKLDLKLKNDGIIKDYAGNAKVIINTNPLNYYIKKIYRKIRYQIIERI